MLSNAGVIYRRLREIAEHGLAAAGNSASAEARLREFHDVVAFIEAELPRLIDGFLRDRATNKTPMPVGAGGKEPS